MRELAESGALEGGRGAYRLVRGKANVPRGVLLGMATCLGAFALSVFSSVDPRATALAWLGWAGLLVPCLAVASRRGRGPMPGALQALWLVPTFLLMAWMLYETATGRHWLGPAQTRLGYPEIPNSSEAAQFSLLLFAWAGQRAAALRQYREAVRVFDQGYTSLQARLSLDAAEIQGGDGRFSIAGGFTPGLVSGDYGKKLRPPIRWASIPLQVFPSRATNAPMFILTVGSCPSCTSSMDGYNPG